MMANYQVGDWVKVVGGYANRSYFGKILSIIDDDAHIIDLEIANGAIYDLWCMKIELATRDEIMMHFLEN